MPGSFGWLAGPEANMPWGSPGVHYAWMTLMEWLEPKQALAGVSGNTLKLEVTLAGWLEVGQGWVEGYLGESWCRLRA